MIQIPDEPTRIIEHLPDGRIRYRTTFDGIQTGWQVGLFAVREGAIDLGVGFCARCDQAIGHGRSFAVDCLWDTVPPLRGLAAPNSRDAAMVVADSAHDMNHPEFITWLCEQQHAHDDHGTPYTLFRVWLRERAA